MATRKPLVIISGLVQQLPTGDTIDAPVSQIDVVSLTNGSGAALVVGTPVYISASNTVQKSSANASLTAKVFGLVRDTSIAISALGAIQTDGVLTATTAQWDAVTLQSGGLTPGATYYLAIAGGLTVNAPITSGEYVLETAVAISSTSIEISRSMRVLL